LFSFSCLTTAIWFFIKKCLYTKKYKIRMFSFWFR
jgi:hypothetical protein